MACPEVASVITSGRCQSELIFGSGAHLVCGSTATHVMWLLTHKDNGSANEDWNATVDKCAALPNVEGWEPWVAEMINATPPNSTINWRLMWRNPRENWCSPEARIIQIGDAAYTFLPTSAVGATMAIEDATTLATTLQLGERSNAPLAVKIPNKLRFEHVTCAQKMGFKNRESLHENNKGSRAVGRDLLSPKWPIHHDPEQYAYDMYSKCVNHIISGASFQNTKSVPGHTFKPSTVQEMIEVSERHEAVLDDGEWA